VHRRRRLAAPFTDAPVGRDIFDLMGEDLESERLERGARRIADEAQDLVVERVNGRRLPSAASQQQHSD